jgi:hypothetical protein
VGNLFLVSHELSGIARFKDIPPSDTMLYIPDNDTILVMHIELSILGDHLLRGTDAPESMGFSLTKGGNAYINHEPDTKEETKILFDELSRREKLLGSCRKCSGVSSTAALLIRLEYR